MIAIRDVVRRFPVASETIVAVDGVNVDVTEGDFVCLYGASGSGKSTLLSLIAGLDVPDGGEIKVDGKSLAGLSENHRADLRLTSVGIVFQENNLIAEFTAGENVFLPLLARGYPRATAAQEAHDMLELVGIGDLFSRLPNTMSGGQRQRVGIARALAGGRRILLADEPTGALDSTNSRSLFAEIRRLCAEHRATAVVATHDPLAREYATTVWTMRDGRLVAG